MQIFYGICIYMLASSFLMVAYVWVRNVITRKSVAVQVAHEKQELFEETEPEDSILEEYHHYGQKKTA